MSKAAVLLALSGLAFPAHADALVYPTGDPAQDVPAVQAAVDEGGTVLLKAVDVNGIPQAFDFGEYPVGAVDWDEPGLGSVALGTSGDLVILLAGNAAYLFSVGNDVHLLGEAVGEARTTIRGGTVPIRNFVPIGPSGNLVFGLGKLTVEGIRFLEPAFQAVYLAQFGGVPEVRELVAELGLDVAIEVRGNAFVDPKPAITWMWLAQAAMADGPAGQARIEDNEALFTPGRFTAEQRRYENDHNMGQRPELLEGLSITDLHAAGELSGNHVVGPQVGLHVWLGGSDAVRIGDNHVELGPIGFYGIACEANHAYVLERNTVIAAGRFPDGISLWASDPTLGINHSILRHNRVVLDGSDFGGITLYTGGSANQFLQNTVEGSGAYAVGLASPFLPAQFFARDNLLRGNQISQFVPRFSSFWGEGADVLFDVNAIGNVLLGRSGLVRDLGEDNSATGWNHRGRGGHGERRSPSLGPTSKHDLVHAARPKPLDCPAATAAPVSLREK
ncbi:MAG TPA: right-handed parallel beta-helix repeat-containing protein [Candidatus Polarisedimenticolaceae bacterium]|nr:right-handed parallel beta-helix repeat-containing protein [Candidatus Polarisedimenticolaceae bacterium]